MILGPKLSWWCSTLKSEKEDARKKKVKPKNKKKNNNKEEERKIIGRPTNSRNTRGKINEAIQT